MSGADGKFETRAIHVGQEPDPSTGAVTRPIYQTSTFVFDEVGVHKGFDYGRSGNPTRTSLQQQVASLEGGAWAYAYGSGLAAAQQVMWLLRPGHHLLLSDDAYGGSHRMVTKIFTNYGITNTLVDMSDLDAVRAAIRPETRLVWVETPTNPYLKIADIAGIVSVVRDSRVDAKVFVDNTFASPYLQRPLELGADIVMHSTTKYLAGHSDLLGGVLIGNDPALGEAFMFHQKAAGAIPGPMDMWLTVRGIKTLPVRMERHCANGQAVAEFLQEHPAVGQVFYPGLPSHPGHEIAKRQMNGKFAGMVSFTVMGPVDLAKAVCNATEVFSLAVSLGGVESLIEYPAGMTHAVVVGTDAEVDPTLVRLSVGLEHVDDLIGDLKQALDRVL